MVVTLFHKLVYEAVSQIPRGRITTYGAIAEALGDKVAARAVAKVLSENEDPEGIPCYKVVMSDGKLGGYAFGGPQEKARRLREEGIEVKEGRVEVERYLFKDFEVFPILRKMKEAQMIIAKMNEKRSFEFEYVVGVDVAYHEGWGVGAAVFMDRKGEVLDVSFWKGRVEFPYVPTYLAFREAPFMVKSAETFEDYLLLVDGQGTAHPRRAGEAVHVGAVLDVPSIGVAKSPLLRNQKSVGKAYISPGWMLPDTEMVFEVWFKGKKQPEALEIAHREATRFVREMKEGVR